MIRALLIALMVLTLSHPAQAADKTSKASKDAAVAESKPKPRTEDEEKKIAEKRKHIEEKKTELNGSSWELALRSSDPKVKAESDTFTFQDGQFSSKNLAKRGFAPTNYTITIPSEGTELAVWETMQTGKDGVIFIRGEWEKDKMNGNITEQLDGGKKTVEYSFSTSSRASISPSSKKDEKTEEGAPAPKGGSKAESGTDSLVSKEKVSVPEKAAKKVKGGVAAFAPGTTDEASDSSSK